MSSISLLDTLQTLHEGSATPSLGVKGALNAETDPSDVGRRAEEGTERNAIPGLEVLKG
jgi:hypothetical protein